MKTAAPKPAPSGMAKAKVRRNSKTSAFWAGQNWALTTAEIMRATGKSKSAVRLNRLIHAPETHRKGKSSKPIVAPWKTLDWSRTSVSLASAIGCCTKTVRRRRRLYAPKTIRVRVDKPGRYQKKS